MGITIKELSKRMNADGYKLTENAIKYYLGMGLLPTPEKQGSHGAGVRLVFLDEDEVLGTLRMIFELKGKGYKLSEISKELRKQHVAKARAARAESLKRYIEVDGEFYQIVSMEPSPSHEKHRKRIIELVSDDFVHTTEFYAYNPCSFLKCDMAIKRVWFSEIPDSFGNDIKNVLKHGLFIPTRMHGDRLIYSEGDLRQIGEWVMLHNEAGYGWDVLQAISRKHAENLEKFFFWPNADGELFSVPWIEVIKKQQRNECGWVFARYIESLDWHPLDPRSNSLFSEWDFRYNDLNEFVEDFISERCAFVPSHTAGMLTFSMFLKKFEP